MQVTTEQREVSADPGSAQRILVRVVNTGTIIDGLSARLIGAGDAPVRTEPEILPLFPEAEGQIALTVALPETQPAGRHPLTVEVRSHTTGSLHHADLELDVAARPALAVVRTPRTIRARRSGRFVLAIANQGNVALDITVSSAPGDAGTTVGLSPSLLRVEPGTTTSVMAMVRGPRMFTGSEVDRTVGIEVVAAPAGTSAAPSEVEPEPALTHATVLQLRQRPLISRGLLTFLILAAVVALWAAVFLFGMINVLSGDPVTKTAPASFFVSADDGANGAGGDPAAPADALPKEGPLPPGVGGEITGTVTARSDGGPVGRILVEAFRTDEDGKTIRVSSGATQSDGSYTLSGLFPTSYRLKFSAEGYDKVWYPNAEAAGGAKQVAAIAQGTVDGINTVVRGQPATISGLVDSVGDTDTPTTQVVARLLSSAGDTPVAARTTTDASGRFVLSDLAAPGTYEISFVAEGYRAANVVQRVTGGEDRIQPTVLLSAGGGLISGRLTDGDEGLGGATVTTTVDGETVSVVTPTMGEVGAYSLRDLPTPGTYVVTFAADGHGSRTEIVDLGPGESRVGYDHELTAGTGSISGVVEGPGNKGLGGVEVTVGGAATPDGTPPTTISLTNADAGLTDAGVGSFAFNDLPVPGDYTLTFTMAGFAVHTLPVKLEAESGTEKVRARLTRRLGELTGAVTLPNGDKVVGATVTATNGLATYTAVSSSPSEDLPSGGYLISDLAPGWYSVTVTKDRYRPQTALVQVLEGKIRTRRDLVLRRDGS